MFPEYFRSGWSQILGTVVAVILQAECPSCHSNNRLTALKATEN